ncbi:MAG: glutamate-1-semialdehyde 2,1-aminomutase [Acidobacteriota bacterium]
MKKKFLPESASLFQRASRVIPGGVNSPVRAFKAVGGTPPFISSADGCLLYDMDGNSYIDYVGSWGPMILGHAHPEVVEALQAAVSKGTSYGAPTEVEVRMAEIICEMVTSIQKVRLVSSGTEATMTALRLARGYTGRSKLIKFEGCYHGHGDSFLVEAGSGVATLGIPGTPGIPRVLAELTISLPYGNLDQVEQTFLDYPGEIAAVICEPVVGNMGLIMPPPEFLYGLISLSEQHGALAIFDEVMTGFRVNPGGVQGIYGLSPHLTCLGKIVGGGLPIGAFGGRADIMDRIAPEGDVYQAGTLSGNPLAVTAGLKTLEILRSGNVYPELEGKSSRLCRGLEKVAEKAGIPVQVPRCGSMFTVYFTGKPVTDFSSAKKCDLDRFKMYFNGMLDRGIYLAPSQFEACFVSAAHNGEAIDRTLEAAESVFAGL